MHTEALTESAKVLLPQFKNFHGFYLAGGTALALHYPFPLLYPLVEWEINLASVREIAAMKAYTIGRRGTFKDYVDLYYILKFDITIDSIIQDAEKKYRGAFNPRLFLEQLVYFADITDTDIHFVKPAVSPEELEKFFETEIRKIKL